MLYYDPVGTSMLMPFKIDFSINFTFAKWGYLLRRARSNTMHRVYYPQKIDYALDSAISRFPGTHFVVQANNKLETL